jgi:signal peptidase I
MGGSVIKPKPEFTLIGPRQARVMRGYVHGGSMAPTLRRGDRITVMPAVEYRWGEIILFARDSSFIIHRALGILPGQIITKGDASYRLDPPVSRQDILGRAVIMERTGKVQVLDSCGARWWGLMVGLGAMVIYPVLDSLRALVRFWRQRQRAADS